MSTAPSSTNLHSVPLTEMVKRDQGINQTRQCQTVKNMADTVLVDGCA